jgi:hypothetical protein
MFPEAIIYAIEAADENFALLERNTGKHPNVVAIQAALWPRLEKIGNSESWAFEVGRSANGGIPVVFEDENALQWLMAVRTLFIETHDPKNGDLSQS